MWGCENDDFKVFCKVFQDLLGMGTDIDARLDDLTCGKCDRKFDIIGRCEGIITVNESLIQIKDNSLFA